MQNFRNLKVWQRGHSLTLEVYKVTESFPSNELYGLTSQLRRACASVPANIAEGCGRSGDPEFGRFLRIAMGSACELEYHLLLAHDLNLLNKADYHKLNQETIELKQMLAAFIKKLRADTAVKLLAESRKLIADS
jgi:four helix bundle protein